jgi:uncharacterized protein (DUF983 family)
MDIKIGHYYRNKETGNLKSVVTVIKEGIVLKCPTTGTGYLISEVNFLNEYTEYNP